MKKSAPVNVIKQIYDVLKIDKTASVFRASRLAVVLLACHTIQQMLAINNNFDICFLDKGF